MDHERTPIQLVNVIDVEATCWAPSDAPGTQEIIEIGVTVVDTVARRIAGTESILVRPTTSAISPFCTSLTTLTPELVEERGVSFGEALKILRKKYQSKDRVFASYGDFDRKMFDRQVTRESLSSPFGPRHLNVKSLFALQHGLPSEVGMAEALAMLGLELLGTHHRGGDDSANIARILLAILGGAGLVGAAGVPSSSSGSPA
jgi:inhibitor of KinA sporulation pathway (predicted exonuclease)